MLSSDAIRHALLAKGMVRDQNDHEMFRKALEGVTTLVTKLSRHGKNHDVPDHLASAMASQLCLRLAEFKQLVSCNMSEAEWDRLVLQRCTGGKNPFARR